MRIQPAIVPMAAALLLAGCGRGDAPAFAGAWLSTDGAYSMSLLGTGTQLGGTGEQRRPQLPDRPFVVSGDLSTPAAVVVFTYQDDATSQAFHYSQSGEDSLTLNGPAATLQFTREE
jgi:hypothetical protein